MRFSPKHLFIIGVALLVTLGTLSVFAQTEEPSQLRFVHTVPEAPAVDVYINGTLSASGLEYGAVSPYVAVTAGDHQISVTEAGTTTELWQQTVTSSANTAYTLIAANSDPLAFQQYRDDLTPLALGKNRFTAIHAVPELSTIDVLLADGRPLIPSLQYGQTFGTFDLPVFAYNLAISPFSEGIENAITAVDTYLLNSGTAYALLLYGSEENPEVLLLNTPTNAEPNNGAVRLVHGIPEGPAVDVYFNETLVAASLSPDVTSTGYFALPAGDYEVIVREAGTQTNVALANVTVEANEQVTAVIAFMNEGVGVQPVSAEIQTGSASESVFKLINLLGEGSEVSLVLDDGTALVSDVAAGSSASGVSSATEGPLTVNVTENGENTELAVDLAQIVASLQSDIVVVPGKDGPEALLLSPASMPQGIGNAAVPVVSAQATAGPTQVTLQAATLAPTVAQATAAPTVAQPTAAPVQPTILPTATLAMVATQGPPTGRVLLDANANLQLRQYPSSESLSLGLAPSGTVLIINGREGAPVLPVGVTPEPDATEFVDPATLIGPNEDLPLAETWLNITYNTPDGGTITAWVNALYVAVTAADGRPIRLATLPTIPGNRAGEANNTAITPPTERVAQVTAVVGGMDEGVNLQIRRIPTIDGESLALVPTDTELEFLGINEDRDWALVRYNSPDGAIVTGWANIIFLVRYNFQGRAIDFEEMEQRNLLETISEDERGRVTGGVQPTAVPGTIQDQVVGQVRLDQGANLQFRRTPSIQAESIGLIPSGAQVIVEGRDETGDWLRVTYEGQSGWVAVLYVQLTLNGRPHRVADLTIIDGVSGEPLPGSVTGATPQPTAEPTAQRFPAVIVSDAVGMTVEPGGSGVGMPVLSIGREVLFIFNSPDGLFSLIELSDGTVGWVPAGSVRLLQP